MNWVKSGSAKMLMIIIFIILMAITYKIRKKKARYIPIIAFVIIYIGFYYYATNIAVDTQ